MVTQGRRGKIQVRLNLARGGSFVTRLNHPT